MLATRLNAFMWLLSTVVVFIAFLVWWPDDEITAYTLFPIFGLIAFSLMWTHYIGGALRRYLGLNKTVLRRQFLITSYIVLFCILVHPALLDIQLYRDGLGLPIESLPAVYSKASEQVAILAGATALLCFLFYELHRFLSEKTWWKYVEWANVAAMGLILWHGFVLGGAFNTDWFQVLWLFYTLSFIASVIYSEYHKRRYEYGKEII